MLRVEGLSKGYGGRTLLGAVSLHVHPNDRIGLVGRNGEGKTTLLRLLAAVEPSDDGRVALRRGAQIGYLRQEVDPRSERPLIEEVRTVHAPLQELEQRMRALEQDIAREGSEGGAVPEALASRYDAASEQFRAAGGFEAEADLRATLVGLGIGPERWQRPLRTFSGGWLMRVELAKLLLQRPEVLLLDEPTNHLDIPAIRWFESVLATYPGAVIVVSHDRVFLDRHVRRIAELADGRLTVYAGNYSDYLRQKALRESEVLARRANLDRQIAHARKFVERFGAKATKATQAESRKKRIAKLEAERDGLALAPERRKLRFRFRPVPRSGDVVLRLEGVRKSYGDNLVYRSLDLELRRGDRIALVGPNGAGKSTLLRIVAGVLAIDAGAREVGHNVAPAFYAQHQLEALRGGNTVLEEVEAAASLDEIPRLRTLLGTFLFSGDDVQKRVSVLSGGEKARVALARLLLGEANLLVLDEPTNHLDLQAREMLAGALDQFDGTMMFISHDRSFINSLANGVVEILPGEDGAELRRFPGDYDDYARGTEADAPATGLARRIATSRVEGRARDSRERRRGRQQGSRVRTLRTRQADAESAIEELEQQLERVGWLQADPAVARDGERMRELGDERRTHQESLDQLYSEWEGLSAQLEALEELAD